MQRPVAYRRYAEECRALAENLDDAEHGRLLDLAAQWEQLARQCERRYSLEDQREMLIEAR
jgi:hypothetical protein